MGEKKIFIFCEENGNFASDIKNDLKGAGYKVYFNKAEECGKGNFINSEEAAEKMLGWITNNYKEDYHNSIQELYKCLYHSKSRETSFEIVNLLINKKYADFNDILNYISMSKGDSKWNQAAEAIDEYLKENSFNEIEKAYFFYTIGRVYVDDLENFEKAKQYLDDSIKIYQSHSDQAKVNIVKNTLSMHYFSKGNHKKAKEILQPVYEEMIENNQVDYSEDMIETVYSNYKAYCKAGGITLKRDFTNMEVKAYFLNNSAIREIQMGNQDNAEKFFDEALNVADKNQKNYAKAAILYNKSLLLDDKESFNASKSIVDGNQYSIGKYILNNSTSSENVLNTLKVDKKNYWVCLKNIDLLI